MRDVVLDACQAKFRHDFGKGCEDVSDDFTLEQVDALVGGSQPFVTYMFESCLERVALV